MEDKKHDIIIMYLARNVNIYLSCQQLVVKLKKKLALNLKKGV